jgi:hypothetical protein
VPKKNNPAPVTIIGGGLAGTEATFQLVRRGIPVRLYEMRPRVGTGAHQTDLLAELVCSNSLGSNLPDRASGLLKEELRAFGSYILDTAYKYRVPAGNALAVDRDAFAREITRYVKGHSLVEFINEEADSIPEEGLVIVATGPLTSPAMLQFLAKKFGHKHLSFFDAIAPIVEADSIDLNHAFRADRYHPEAKGDHINCPLTKEEYETFVAELLKARKIELPAFEKEARKQFFCACQPIEQIATLRLMPNMAVWRPCDTVETMVAWAKAVEKRDGPTSLILSRQNLPFIKRTDAQIALIERGGYVLSDCEGTPKVVLIATGSEVDLALKSQEALKAEGIAARVVSMPSTDAFDRQDQAYKDSVLPKGVKRVAIEAGSTDGWWKYVGCDGAVIGINRFGESAPANVLFKEFGFTVENVVATVKGIL